MRICSIMAYELKYFFHDPFIDLIIPFDCNMMNTYQLAHASIFKRLPLLLLFISSVIATSAQETVIKNDTFWNTKDGKAIFSQGGGIFRFKDPATAQLKYYWYGVNYKQAALYRANPTITQGSATFESVTCYSSTDLVNWTFEQNVLTKEELTQQGGKTGWLGRLGVAYLKELHQYALVVQHNAKVLILTADSPTGKFKQHQELDMTALIGTSNTGDQTVFTDDDGKSYLIYSYGRGRNKIYVSEIGVKKGKINLLDCTQVYRGAGREGNCLFKYQGKYYMCASDLYGWDASHAYYLVAKDIRGPYTPTDRMLVMPGCADDFAHITQTGFFYTLKGSEKETVIFCGDRWADFAGNGLGYNQWLPLSFNGDTPYFNSLSAWDLNEKTGTWKVNKANNYVKNGSFEADRRRIPSNFKPIQEQLTGWQSLVLKGNAISLDSLHSPKLNFFNSQTDRASVIGEKSLYIHDKVDFERNVCQTINATPFVKMEDGDYTLSAKIKNSAGFTKLQMYAKVGEQTYQFLVKEENPNWKTIKLEHIKITNGKVEIGFRTAAAANAFCNMDDVTLVKSDGG